MRPLPQPMLDLTRVCAPSLALSSGILTIFAERETESQRILIHCLKVAEQAIAEPRFEFRSFNSRASATWLSLATERALEGRGAAKRNHALQGHRVNL